MGDDARGTVARKLLERIEGLVRRENVARNILGRAVTARDCSSRRGDDVYGRIERQLVAVGEVAEPDVGRVERRLASGGKRSPSQVEGPDSKPSPVKISS